MRHCNLFPNKPLFLHVCSTSLLKTLWEKEKLLIFPQCFLPFWRTFHHFHQTLKLSSANSFNLEESKICRWELNCTKLKFFHLTKSYYTPTKGMFPGVYWNQPVCPSICPFICVSVHPCVCVQNKVCQSAGGGH